MSRVLSPGIWGWELIPLVAVTEDVGAIELVTALVSTTEDDGATELDVTILTERNKIWKGKVYNSEVLKAMRLIQLWNP